MTDIAAWERDIEHAMRPGRFIDYRDIDEFVIDLEELLSEVVGLVHEEPSDAVALLETLLAAAYEKTEEVHDSSGEFGTFVKALFVEWVRARQEANANAEETIRLLLRWIDSDDYGYCDNTESDAIRVLDNEGLASLANTMRTRLSTPTTTYNDPRDDYLRKRWRTTLRDVLVAQNDLSGLITLAEEEEPSQQDCSAIATMLDKRGDLSEALAWVERGLSSAARSNAEHRLQSQQLDLLPRLGRRDEAVAIAWAEFERLPFHLNYRTLMGVVLDQDRASWHEKAMEVAQRSDLSSALTLFIETGEFGRLARRIDVTTDSELEELSHYTTGPVARHLAEPHPGLAARVYKALAMRIVNAGKSTYYEEALRDFERARDCYAKADQQDQWNCLVDEVRRRHKRKYSFMPRFERIVAGESIIEPRPAFLERARSRWPRSGSD